MTENEGDTHPDETPFKWLIWEWKNDPKFMVIIAAAFVLSFALMPRMGDYSFALPGALGAAMMVKYGLWIYAVRKYKKAQKNA